MLFLIFTRSTVCILLKNGTEIIAGGKTYCVKHQHLSLMRLFFYKTDRQTTGRIYNSCYFLTIRDRAIENEKCFFIIKAVDDKGWKKEESINERKKNMKIFTM